MSKKVVFLYFFLTWKDWNGISLAASQLLHSSHSVIHDIICVQLSFLHFQDQWISSPTPPIQRNRKSVPYNPWYSCRQVLADVIHQTLETILGRLRDVTLMSKRIRSFSFLTCSGSAASWCNPLSHLGQRATLATRMSEEPLLLLQNTACLRLLTGITTPCLARSTHEANDAPSHDPH